MFTFTCLFTEYVHQRPDANISISAVVSASCVIVNDQQQDASASRPMPFPDGTFVDTVFEETDNMSCPFASSRYPPPCDTGHQSGTGNTGYNTGYNANTTPCSLTEELQFPNFNLPIIDTNQCANTMNAIEDQQLYNSHTAYTNYDATGYGEKGFSQSNYNNSNLTDTNGMNYVTDCFDPGTVYMEQSVPVSSSESYLSDSSHPADFDPCRINTKGAFPNLKIESPTANNGINVDEMISSGATIAGFKPRGIIRKRKKCRTPTEDKDGCYWSKRIKNNDSARRSRETKKEKERNFYKRALELEYENFYLKEKITQLENQLASINTECANVSLSDAFV